MSFRIRNSACLIVFVLSAVALGLSQQAPPPSHQTAVISGTVLDATGNTVQHATVVLQEPQNHRTITTGSDGFFQFQDVKPGVPVHIDVSALEFKNWSSSEITLQPGQAILVKDVTLAVAPVETTVTVVPPELVAEEQVKIQEQQRVLGVIPNFYVTYDRQPAPMTSKLKFQLAFKALTDPVTIAGFGLNAAIYQAAGYPSYQQGAAGYGQRLGATFAGGYSKIIIGDAILPSLLHQDPRYFYQGTGSTKSRLLHALGCAFITRGDNGKREINWSDLGGDLASGAIANAYYPSSDRGAGLVARSALIGAGGRMAFGVVQEFVLRKWTSHSK